MSSKKNNNLYKRIVIDVLWCTAESNPLEFTEQWMFYYLVHLPEYKICVHINPHM
jgi:hypothetical protein